MSSHATDLSVYAKSSSSSSSSANAHCYIDLVQAERLSEIWLNVRFRLNIRLKRSVLAEYSAAEFKLGLTVK